MHPSFFFVPALAAIGVVALVLFRESKSTSHRFFILGLLLLGLETGLAGFSYLGITPEEKASFQRVRVALGGFLPVVWTLFSLTYSRGNSASFLKKWGAALAILALTPLVALWFWDDLITGVNYSPEQGLTFKLGVTGVVLHLLILVGAVATLMNLERTFHAAVGTMRWQIKFMLLGVAVIFAVRIYTSSQVILYRSTTFPLQLINAAGLLVGAVLLLRALTRAGIFKVDVYPSERFLQYSITGFLAGAYLLIVGLFARLVTVLGGENAFPVKAFLILIALVLLAVFLLSERLRQYLQEFIARHFARPQYDYRKIWLGLTERTASILDADQLSVAVANWVSETLHVLSVTIWLVDERAGQLRLAASTCFLDANPSGVPAEDQQKLIQHLQGAVQPIILEQADGQWAEILKSFYADYFKKGGSRVCVPLLAGGKFLGMITLGDRVNGAPYDTEELDLLKCIGDQFASNLLNLRLSSELVQAREMEAFQTISAFFVHDLKNTASTLNLMLQNFRVHFDNPDFREDALRAIAKTTTHIQDLIRRLSLFRQRLELVPKPVDLGEVVTSAAECLQARPNLKVATDFAQMPKLQADPEQLHKVFTNLLMNAAEAAPKDGQVRIQTFQMNGWAIVSVSDNGCGMTPDFIRQSLFRPFQSTKKGGLGIGMFHSRMIVEAHRGKIEVQSEPGVGTSFRVLLPTH